MNNTQIEAVITDEVFRMFGIVLARDDVLYEALDSLQFMELQTSLDKRFFLSPTRSLTLDEMRTVALFASNISVGRREG